MAKTKVLICPYCGETQPAAERCRACGGLFEPLSRQATHNEMGPWFIRDLNRPFQPGCSYETLIKLIERGQITKFSILRGPTTKQFWTIARRVPGVSHLLGYCHNCDASVDVGDHGCHACGVPFGAYLDRNYLGLPEVRPLPWEAPTGDDEHRAEPASARMMDFRRAAEPLGISSFASDEEIRSGGIGSQGLGQPIHVAPTYHPTLIGSLSATAAGTTLQTAETRTGSLESLPASIAARAAQRKLDDQKKTIRLLIVGILLLGLAVIWLFYTSIVPSTSGTNSEGTSQPPPSAKTASPNAGTSIAQPATSPESAGVSPPATQPTTLPVNLEDVLARAQQQIAVGEQTDRDLPARIAAYEQALSILNEVDPQTLPDPQRSDLAEGIKAVERALNDLRLKSYFP